MEFFLPIKGKKHGFIIKRQGTSREEKGQHREDKWRTKYKNVERFRNGKQYELDIVCDVLHTRYIL